VTCAKVARFRKVFPRFAADEGGGSGGRAGIRGDRDGGPGRGDGAPCGGVDEGLVTETDNDGVGAERCRDVDADREAMSMPTASEVAWPSAQFGLSTRSTSGGSGSRDTAPDTTTMRSIGAPSAIAVRTAAMEWSMTRVPRKRERSLCRSPRNREPAPAARMRATITAPACPESVVTTTSHR